MALAVADAGRAGRALDRPLGGLSLVLATMPLAPLVLALALAFSPSSQTNVVPLPCRVAAAGNAGRVGRAVGAVARAVRRREPGDRW
ncbi:MAG: hypothetical protein ACRD0K_22240 [Egibacteraceae bacterium]